MTYSAVIYGASTKVGKAYAHYLAKKGFNLILVERDMQILNDLEVNLRDLRESMQDSPKVTKIVLDRFD